jgi:hypothetical protein
MAELELESLQSRKTSQWLILLYKVVPAIKPEDYQTCICIYEYVEDTNTGFNSTGERAPIDGVGEQIWSSQWR